MTMLINDIIQDWYENEILDCISSDFMFCPYCDKRVYRTNFYKHVRNIHDRSFEEMIEECCLHDNLPVCPYPGCKNVLVLRYPTKIGAGLQEYCCRQHSSSLNMKRMRRDPVLREKHAKEASKRLTDNNPTRLEQNRRKASSRMLKNWESSDYREKVITGARKNIVRLLLDDDFLSKKSDVASRRMIKMNKDDDFLNKSAKGRVVSNEKGEVILYVLIYNSFIKVGVTATLNRRLRSLKGYVHVITYTLPSEMAGEIEYSIKQSFENYIGDVPKGMPRTEVFHLDDENRIIKFINEKIK